MSPPLRILLATDGSSHARRATRWLRDLALPPATTVTVLTVATLHEPPRDARTVRDLWATARARAEGVGERAARMLAPRWPRVRVVIAQGDPSPEIGYAAEEMKIGLIVVGARGLSPMKRVWLGSTSLGVARYAPCPVAIVRGRLRKTGRVLVAVDGSDGSRAAVRFLAASGLEPESRVVLLHVLPGRQDDRRRADSSDAGTDRMLRDVAAMLRSRRGAERVVTHGDPARQIVEIAGSRDVDLVVLGARGLGALRRLLLGSVSEAVLHHVRRPVIISRE